MAETRLDTPVLYVPKEAAEGILCETLESNGAGNICVQFFVASKARSKFDCTMVEE